MRHSTNNCNFNIIRNEVNEHEELAAKRPRASHCQPSSAAQGTSKTADKGICEEGCDDVSTFSDYAIKCASNLFHSKYHQFYNKSGRAVEAGFLSINNLL